MAGKPKTSHRPPTIPSTIATIPQELASPRVPTHLISPPNIKPTATTNTAVAFTHLNTSLCHISFIPAVVPTKTINIPTCAIVTHPCLLHHPPHTAFPCPKIASNPHTPNHAATASNPSFLPTFHLPAIIRATHHASTTPHNQYTRPTSRKLPSRKITKGVSITSPINILSSMRRYVFTTILISCLAIFTYLPSLPPLITTVPGSSSPAIFTISGQVETNLHLSRQPQVFVELSRLTDFRIGPLSFSAYTRFAPLPLDATNSFTLKEVPPGNYRITPLTLPQMGVFFTTVYPVTVSDKNPPPVTVAPPITSFFTYLKCIISSAC